MRIRNLKRSREHSVRKDISCDLDGRLGNGPVITITDHDHHFAIRGGSGTVTDHALDHDLSLLLRNFGCIIEELLFWQISTVGRDQPDVTIHARTRIPARMKLRRISPHEELVRAFAEIWSEVRRES